MRSEVSTWWTPSRNLPSKRSPSSSAMKSWKSASLPLCGVAVSSRKCRQRPARSLPSFGHKRSTLTSILDRLERRGLVRRGPHPASRRLVMVQLADAGQQVGKRISTILHELDAVVIERTGPSDVDAFSRVIGAIEEGVT